MARDSSDGPGEEAWDDQRVPVFMRRSDPYTLAPMRLGIDFGTTRTVVAVRDGGNFPILSFTPSSGHPIEHYPTLVVEREGELLFGLDAFDRIDDPEWSLLRSFKRALSAPGATPDTRVRIGSTELTLLDLTSRFLAALRADLLERSNLPKRSKKEDRMEAIVATPANAHNAQRFVTIEGFRAAGFEVVALMNEPSAAGVEYAHRYESTITAKRENVLVYDLGGGTFDASIVHMRGKEHDVVATRGVQELGGDDFDRILLDLALAQTEVSADELDPSVRDRLLDHCRQAKESLNPNSRKVPVELSAYLDGVESVSVATAAYYDACLPLVEQTLAVIESLVGDDIENVAGLYVVGGASSLPVVARRLKEVYARRVHRSVYPSASTAIGLAIAFDEHSEYSVTDRFSRHFGVFREGQGGAEVTFDPIFSADHPLPAPGQSASVERRTYRPVHNVGHFRYVECGWLDREGQPSSQITPFADVRFPFDPELRTADLEQVPIQRSRNEGPLIEERYTMDAAGIVTLEIIDRENGFSENFRLSR
jgi:molecular chaperone DnaK (HSP70)